MYYEKQRYFTSIVQYQVQSCGLSQLAWLTHMMHDLAAGTSGNSCSQGVNVTDADPPGEAAADATDTFQGGTGKTFIIAVVVFLVAAVIDIAAAVSAFRLLWRRQGGIPDAGAL